MPAYTTLSGLERRDAFKSWILKKLRNGRTPKKIPKAHKPKDKKPKVKKTKDLKPKKKRPKTTKSNRRYVSKKNKYKKFTIMDTFQWKREPKVTTSLSFDEGMKIISNAKLLVKQQMSNTDSKYAHKCRVTEMLNNLSTFPEDKNWQTLMCETASDIVNSKIKNMYTLIV